jgi:hypothetical protein
MLPLPERERERKKSVEKKELTGGTHLSAREREGRGRWAGLLRAGRSVLGSGSAQAGRSSPYLFFILFSFSFVSDFCFGF